MSGCDTEQPQLEENKDDTHKPADRPFPWRRYSWTSHSSRSSSFNAGATEILLGYFWDSENASVMDIDPSDDPTIQEALILWQAQDPSSWVSKMLAKPYLWSDPDSDDGSKQSDPEVGSHVKRARSESPTDLSEDGGNERKLRKSDRTGDATDARRELQQEGSSDYNHEPFNRKSDRWQVRVSKLLCTPPVSLDGVSSFLMLPYGPDRWIFAHLDPSRTAKKGD
ncbi:hypothetical protein HD554DRAFT_2041857 [Boletus coccyginus]|nr:hypothetical protein HD554DRAFT_2041857 [Boletus coccyginus]